MEIAHTLQSQNRHWTALNALSCFFREIVRIEAVSQIPRHLDGDIPSAGSVRVNVRRLFAETCGGLPHHVERVHYKRIP